MGTGRKNIFDYCLLRGKCRFNGIRQKVRSGEVGTHLEDKNYESRDDISFFAYIFL